MVLYVVVVCCFAIFVGDCVQTFCHGIHHNVAKILYVLTISTWH